MDLRKIVAELRGDEPFEAFARKVGVSHAAIRVWESGERAPGRLGLRLLIEYAEGVGAKRTVLATLRAALEEKSAGVRA